MYDNSSRKEANLVKVCSMNTNGNGSINF